MGLNTFSGEDPWVCVERDWVAAKKDIPEGPA